ncbi:GNAT family N-acetyltransferase [Gottfriedia luciferensis]|uniref:GNAT family N-acetyltransferase n=1 Tax=Gottfriedia luciferensis TaxID=178774 RepID=UPI000B43B0F5|nr:GNAT family N-acetyltransferase [Gottfriedia luciferensis]
MKVETQKYNKNEISYTIRHALEKDANDLSILRVRIDGETENLDREQGEGYIDPISFKKLIKTDIDRLNNLFLVAEVQGEIVGFSRCEGSLLKRLSHKVEFGVCVLKDYWGYSIGKNLLEKSISWADSNGIKKINLTVLQTNSNAIKLYEKLGFEIEGILKNDKVLSDGKYYNTIMMGRFID